MENLEPYFVSVHTGTFEFIEVKIKMLYFLFIYVF